MYAGATKISSLQQAIGRLGFATITQIVLAVASKTRVFAVPGLRGRGQGGVPARARDRAVRAGDRADAALDGRCRIPRGAVSRFRSAGAAAGARRSASRARRDARSRRRAAPRSMPRTPRSARTLVRSWAMPAKVAEAVARHHAPDGCELATIVALADDFAHGGADTQQLAATLNMYPDDVEAIGKRADDIADDREGDRVTEQTLRHRRDRQRPRRSEGRRAGGEGQGERRRDRRRRGGRRRVRASRHDSVEDAARDRRRARPVAPPLGGRARRPAARTISSSRA